jgi:hypothetical protein
MNDRTVPRGSCALVAFIAGAFGLVAAATALEASGDEDARVAAREAAEGPTTRHVKIGAGATPANGRFELFRATTADGRECFGIKLFNQPTVTGEALFEGCGNPTETSIASNTGHGETIVYGRVPTRADRVRLDVPGQAQRTVKLKPMVARIPYRYFVTVYGEKLGGAKAGTTATGSATATVEDASGEVISSHDIPLPVDAG